MSERKTIQFNPELFKIQGGNKTRKNRKNDGKEIKYKNNNANNKTTKSKLLKYIREQQELKYRSLFDETSNAKNAEMNNQTGNDDNNLFENSVNYLKSVSDKYQNNNNNNNNGSSQTRPTLLANPKNKTIKQLPTNNLPYSGTPPIIHSNLPDIFTQTIAEPTDNSSITLSTKYNFPPPPKWGCLRNGNLQTYREYMKNQTQRNRYNVYQPQPITTLPQNKRQMLPSPPSQTSQNQTMNITDAQRESIIIKKNIEKMNSVKNRNNKLQYLKQKKTIRRTYNVGKSKYQPEVSVLISNKTIRNNITTKSHLLKQVPIQEVKQYLINKGLIRVGTISPNDVLRTMYESAILVGGDIQNHNPDNLLYNYFTKTD